MASEIAAKDFNIKQGTDFRRIFRFKDEAGLPIDLTTWKVKFKAVYRETTITQELPGDISGQAPLHLSPLETRSVPEGRQMFYALESWAPGDTPPGSGDQTVVLEGYLIGEQ